MARNWRKTRTKHVAEQAITEALEVARKQLEDPATAPEAIEKIIRLGERLAKLQRSQERSKAASEGRKTVGKTVWDEVREIEAKRDDGNEPFIMPDYPDPVVPPQSTPSLPPTVTQIETPPSVTVPELPQVPNPLTEQSRERLAAREAWIKAGRPTARVLREWEPPETVIEPRLPSGIERTFPFCGSETPQAWPSWNAEDGWRGANGMTQAEYEESQKPRTRDYPPTAWTGGREK